MKNFILIVMLCLLSACSTTLPVNYVASNSVRGDAEVSVEKFTYVPSESGKIKIDQFQKHPSSLGEMFVSPDVPTLIEKAVKKELSYSGFKLEENSNTSISGTINRFYYDWIGFSEVDFEIEIAFSVIKGSSTYFEHTSFSHQKAPKTPAMAQDSEAVKAAIADCIDQFLSEVKKRNIL